MRCRFKINDMKKYISFSGGVESTTMLVLYGQGAKAIWADTGAEHKEMYARIDYVEQRIKQLHGEDFEIIRVKGKTSAYGTKVDSLIDYIRASKQLPSAPRRFCTDRFKIAPIERFLKHQGECELMIGFNADEEPGKARVGNYMKRKNVHYTYPLYEDGHDRSDCEDILNLYGLHPDFPVYMRRGGCWMCFYKSAAEYKAMYFLDRDTFKKAQDLERSTQDKKKTYYSLLSGKTLDEIERECIEELRFFSESELLSMYKAQPKGKTCGAFCNR